jgi:methyl-accepting chemotaxis protein
MNFDEAINAHSAWKIKLAMYIRRPDGSIKVGDVCVDNKCALGRWIYGEGAKWSHLPQYETLKEEHARFHRSAGEVVKKADKGENMVEEVALGSTSEFASASSAVVKAILEMKASASAG